MRSRLKSSSSSGCWRWSRTRDGALPGVSRRNRSVQKEDVPHWVLQPPSYRGCSTLARCNGLTRGSETPACCKSWTSGSQDLLYLWQRYKRENSRAMKAKAPPINSGAPLLTACTLTPVAQSSSACVQQWRVADAITLAARSGRCKLPCAIAASWRVYQQHSVAWPLACNKSIVNSGGLDRALSPEGRGSGCYSLAMDRM